MMVMVMMMETLGCSGTVTPPSHDALLADMARLEVALEDVRRGVQGLSGALERIQQTVSRPSDWHHVERPHQTACCSPLRSPLGSARRSGFWSTATS